MRNPSLSRLYSYALAVGLLLGLCVSGQVAAQAYEDVVVGRVQYIPYSSELSVQYGSPSLSWVGACKTAVAGEMARHAQSCKGDCTGVHLVREQCSDGGDTSYIYKYSWRDPNWATQPNTGWISVVASCPAGGELDFMSGNCVERIYNYDSCTTKNPVNPGSGEKFFYETDYQGAGAHPLDFQRLYRSNYKGVPSIANGWIHNWQRTINVISAPTVAGSTANVQYADGKHTAFKYNGTAWVTMTNGRFDTLTEVKTGATRTGWQLKVWDSDSVEYYSPSGQLLKIVQRNGWTNTVTYSIASTPATIAPFAGLPIAITNHFGRKLELRYNYLGQLIKLIDPAGGVIQYGYDSSFNLTKVTWQDNTARQYLYATPTNGRLTGVIDEMGIRVGTFTYDTLGRVLSSEKAGGAEKLTFLYNADKSTSITDYTPSPTGVGAPTATTRTHRFGYAQGVVRPTSVTAPCPVCGNTASSYIYDANGNITQRTEHDGTVTKFTYDAKNRETSRVEAAGTTAAKTYTTQWHGTWNLPVLRTEPFKITAYTYDAKGNLTGQAETPTTDGNGALGAAGVRDVANPMTANGWTFDANNLILTTIRTSTPYALASIYLEKLSSTNDIYGNASVIKDLIKNIDYSSAYDRHNNIINSVDFNGKILQQIFNNKGLLIYYKYGDLSFDFSYLPNQTPKPTIVKFKNNIINEIQLENLLQGLSTPANNISPFTWIPFSSAYAQGTFMPSYSPICGACNAGPSAKLGGVIKKGIDLLKKCFAKPKDSTFGNHPSVSDAAKRGWSKKDIDDVINNPDKTVPTRDIRNNPKIGQRNDDPATAYYRGNDYVVRNDITGEIVQISQKGASDWKVPF